MLRPRESRKDGRRSGRRCEAVKKKEVVRRKLMSSKFINRSNGEATFPRLDAWSSST
jgi:hypothetical protein